MIGFFVVVIEIIEFILLSVVLMSGFISIVILCEIGVVINRIVKNFILVGNFFLRNFMTKV